MRDASEEITTLTEFWRVGSDAKSINISCDLAGVAIIGSATMVDGKASCPTCTE